MKDHSLHLTFHDGTSSRKIKPVKKNKKDKASLKVREGQINKEKTYISRKIIRKERNGLKIKILTMFQ